MSWFKKILCSILVLFFVVVFTNCKLVFYGLEQGYGQLQIIRKAEPVEKLLKDPNFPDSLKQKLLLVQEIRKFATDSLGLTDTKNYTTFYDQHGKPIVWIVTACPNYSMEPYTWKFPFIGKVPYKGYFDKAKAEKEGKLLENKGYDIRIGTVSAWSTLGYFKDPILSSMLNRTEGDLADLIIHELTHSTIYIKGNSQFNENIASFIGQEGAKLFLMHKYGLNSPQYLAYINDLSDEISFAGHILRGCGQLDSLYKQFEPDLPVENKETQKQQLITQIVNSLDTIHFLDVRIGKAIRQKKFRPNNAFFTGYKVYNHDLKSFESEFSTKFNSDFKAYIESLKQKYQSI